MPRKSGHSSSSSAQKQVEAGAAARPRRSRVIGKTPEGFEVYAPDRPPTLAQPREIRGWIRRWLDENKKAAKAR